MIFFRLCQGNNYLADEIVYFWEERNSSSPYRHSNQYYLLKLTGGMMVYWIHPSIDFFRTDSIPFANTNKFQDESVFLCCEVKNTTEIDQNYIVSYQTKTMTKNCCLRQVSDLIRNYFMFYQQFAKSRECNTSGICNGYCS